MSEEKQAVWAKGLPGVPKAMFWPGILGGTGDSVYVHSDESLKPEKETCNPKGLLGRHRVDIRDH